MRLWYQYGEHNIAASFSKCSSLDELLISNTNLIGMSRVDKDVLYVQCVKGELHPGPHPLPPDLQGQPRLPPRHIAVGHTRVAV